MECPTFSHPNYPYIPTSIVSNKLLMDSLKGCGLLSWTNQDILMLIVLVPEYLGISLWSVSSVVISSPISHPGPNLLVMDNPLPPSWTGLEERIFWRLQPSSYRTHGIDGIRSQPQALNQITNGVEGGGWVQVLSRWNNRRLTPFSPILLTSFA